MHIQDAKLLNIFQVDSTRLDNRKAERDIFMTSTGKQ